MKNTLHSSSILSAYHELENSTDKAGKFPALLEFLLQTRESHKASKTYSIVDGDTDCGEEDAGKESKYKGPETE